MDQNRKSRMEPAEGSRESMRNSGSGDLGTSSDRAMFNDESSSSGRGSSRSGSGSSGSSERGSGSSSSSERGSSSESESSGGISNRELSREQCEQERVPERGKSKSEG